MIARLLNRLLWPLQREAVRFGYVDGLNKAWGFVNEAITETEAEAEAGALGFASTSVTDKIFIRLETELRDVIYDRSYP